MNQTIRRFRFRPSSVSIVPLALAIAGCSSPALKDCELVSGVADWYDGRYNVTVILKNSSGDPLALQDVYFELTTFDADDQVVVKDYPSVVKGADVDPWDQTRIRLGHTDEKGRGDHSLVVLKDRRGRVLSEYSIPETRNLSHLE